MKGTTISSFLTAPCTKPSTSKTLTEIQVFKEIFNNNAKSTSVFNDTFSK